MRIIVPFTEAPAAASYALEGRHPSYMETPGDNVYAYWEVMDGVFTGKAGDDDVLIVEGDKAPTAEQITEMETCPHLLCGFGGFACTRFRHELWTEERYRRHWLRHRTPPMHWFGMDGQIASVWSWYGVNYHRHAGTIEHWHVGASSDERGTGRKVRQLGHR